MSDTNNINGSGLPMQPDNGAATDVFSTRVHPLVKPNPTRAPVPLISISSVGAPHAAVILYYNSPAAKAMDPRGMERSLAVTLSSYPQLTGRLSLRHENESAPEYTKRNLRSWVSYGENDPGFLFSVGHDRRKLTDILPPLENGFRELSPSVDDALAPAVAPPLTTPDRDLDAPISGARLTRFSDGSAALVVCTPHTLFDAGALGTFISDWHDAHAKISAGVDFTPPPRPFDYIALDANAMDPLTNSTIDNPNSSILALEAKLDVFRYDSWARDPNGVDNPPAELEASLRPPPGHEADPTGPPPPWSSASSAPLRKVALELSESHLHRIHARATCGGQLSANDALVGHLWRLIARARKQDTPILLDCAMACDVRARLPNPVPPTAPGCFNICLGYQLPANVLTSPTGLAIAAARVRQAVNTVTPELVKGWLAVQATNYDPTRQWIVFPGNKTFCSTNWSRCGGLYSADFGAGCPIAVDNFVMGFGGYATIFRTPEGSPPGLVISLWLEAESMARLLEDPELRGGEE